ncbi:MAG: alpha/beta hydrolase [Gammaproteobacteria bacterium]|jgi:pimeloyl-ACP methyl ester carboxylesterase|nr:alpha/beta hydrolase [Gammaproteobacteria bacterium]|tara:strand:- start:261 stop:1211 length:951 start_codon:yes stop_codon:yes gene_type:complete
MFFRIVAKLTLFLVILSYSALVVYAYLPLETSSTKELVTKDDLFIKVSDHDIRYREYRTPEDNNPNLILIHGFGNNLHSWRSITPLLSEHYNIFALDLLGFGLSDKPTDYDYSNVNQAKTVGEFADALKLDSFIVGGHSLGGAIGLHVAMNNKKTKGLILFNPGIINTGVPEFARYINLIFPFARVSAKQFANREFREQFLKRSYYNPSIVNEQVMDEIMIGSKTEDYLQGTSSMLGKFYDANEAELMNQVNTPTLIVFGIEDRNKSMEEALQLKTGFKNSKLQLIQDAGHYVHEESPALVSGSIIREMSFLTERG